MALLAIGTALEFGVLGALMVHHAGRAISLPAKERGLLAFLLLRANEVVPAEQLIDALWPDDPPASARNSLQVRISQLRKVLDANRIETLRNGYRIRASAAELDLLEFRTLVTDARRLRDEDDPLGASDRLADALALWRGDVLPELRSNPFFRTEIGPLEEERWATLEAWADVQLELGHGSDLVPDLQLAVAANPLREQLMRQLMLALYRAGRQTEALSVFNDSRRRLVEELGLEPSPMLADLHRQILAHDPALNPPRRSPVRATAPSRRNVSVVLVDLPLPTDEDPEAVENALARGRDRAREFLERSGAVVSAVGNEVAGAFGLPVSSEHDAQRAMRAALALADDGVRIALDTGIALATDAELRDAQLLGRLRRLLEASELGDVIVGAGAQNTLGGAVKTRGSRVVSFDETAEPIPRRYDAPLIGRDREFRRLLEGFAWAIANRGSHLVTLIGPAGIGKSRLAREFVQAVRSDALVLIGRCPSYESGAFAPLADMVRQAAGAATPTALSQLLGGLEDRKPVIDQLSAALGTGTRTRAEDAFWAFRRLFLALAAERPLVLVFEDLHWADERLLHFIEELVERAEDASLLVLGLARPELVELRPGWGGSRLDSESIRLTPLTSNSSEELIGVLGESMSEAVRLNITARAEGNPLFIEQLVALALEEPEAPPDAIPLSIQSVLAARIDRLPVGERDFLERASVLGHGFSLAAVAALRTKTGSREDPAAIALRLVQRELLRPGEDAGASDDFRFRHILIRDVVYASVLKMKRAELHERIARWFDKYQDRESLLDDVIGYHLARAHELGQELDSLSPRLPQLANEAGTRLATAGGREIERTNLARGIELLEQAVRLLPAESRMRGFALRQLSYGFRLQGDWLTASRYLDEGFAHAASTRDEALKALLTQNELQLRLHTDPAFTSDDFVTELSRSLSVLRNFATPGYMTQAQSLLAWGYALVGQHESALEVIASIENDQDAAELRKLLPSLWLGGRFTVAEATAKCEALLDEEPPPRTTASCYRTLAVLKAMQGDFRGARDLYRADLRILDELGLRVLKEQAATIKAGVELLAGEPDEAEGALRRAIANLRHLGSTLHLAGLSARLARALLLQGRADEGWVALEATRGIAAHDVADRVEFLAVEARLLARRGVVARAERVARCAVAMADNTDSVDLQASARVDLAYVQSERALPAAYDTLADARTRFAEKGNVVEARSTEALMESYVR